MALSSDIRGRIFSAADELHRSSPMGEYPKIEAVRQASRAGMQNVVEAMKEWRAAQHKQVQVVREPLPVELLGEAQDLGVKFWETAQRLANASLETAKASFESEKRDMDAMSAEQAEAFDNQSAELGGALHRIAELDRDAEATAAAAAALTLQLDDIREALVVAEQRASLAEHKAAEVERRAEDLRTELTHAHGEAERLLAELVKTQGRVDAAGMLIERADARTEQLHESFTSQLAKAESSIGELRASLVTQSDKAEATIEQLRQALAAQTAKSSSRMEQLRMESSSMIEQLRMELTTVKGRAETAEKLQADQRERASEEARHAVERVANAKAERDKAREAAAIAREDAAALRGQLEATKNLWQNDAMLLALKPVVLPSEQAPPAAKPGKKS